MNIKKTRIGKWHVLNDLYALKPSCLGMSWQTPLLWILLMLNIYEKFQDRTFNPLKLRPAKTGLTNLEMYYSRKHFLENIWGRTVYQKPNYNSLSHILWIVALFSSYFLKYESSRCLILVECEMVNIREKGGEMQSFPICAVVLYVPRNQLVSAVCTLRVV